MDDDDVPTINRSSAPHGDPANPHTVTSPTSLVCRECGTNLARVWLERLVAKLAPAQEATGG